MLHCNVKNEIIDRIFSKKEGIVSFYENASLIKTVSPLTFTTQNVFFSWSNFLNVTKNVSITYFYLEMEETLLSLFKYACNFIDLRCWL